jgi:hypothetical protein
MTSANDIVKSFLINWDNITQYSDKYIHNLKLKFEKSNGYDTYKNPSKIPSDEYILEYNTTLENRFNGSMLGITTDTIKQALIDTYNDGDIFDQYDTTSVAKYGWGPQTQTWMDDIMLDNIFNRIKNGTRPNSILIKNRLAYLSLRPTITIITDIFIPLLCNDGVNKFEDRIYPIDPLSTDRIPTNLLVGVAKISDIDNWTEGKYIATRCYNARELYDSWYYQTRDFLKDPETGEYFDKSAIEYVKKICDTFGGVPQENYKLPATYNFEDVYSYTLTDLNNYISTFGDINNYTDLSSKRYAVIWKLIQDDLFYSTDLNLITLNGAEKFYTALIESNNANTLIEKLK